MLNDVGHGDLFGRVAIIPDNNRFVLNISRGIVENFEVLLLSKDKQKKIGKYMFEKMFPQDGSNIPKINYLNQFELHTLIEDLSLQKNQVGINLYEWEEKIMD